MLFSKMPVNYNWTTEHSYGRVYSTRTNNIGIRKNNGTEERVVVRRNAQQQFLIALLKYLEQQKSVESVSKPAEFFKEINRLRGDDKFRTGTILVPGTNPHYGLSSLESPLEILDDKGNLRVERDGEGDIIPVTRSHSVLSPIIFNPYTGSDRPYLLCQDKDGKLCFASNLHYAGEVKGIDMRLEKDEAEKITKGLFVLARGQAVSTLAGTLEHFASKH